MYKRIKELCAKNGTNITNLERELGFSRGSICKMETHKPSAEKIQLIAEYFGVTVEYLRTGKESSFPAFEPEHIEIIELYSKLNKEQKDAFMNILRSLAQSVD